MKVVINNWREDGGSGHVGQQWIVLSMPPSTQTCPCDTVCGRDTTVVIHYTPAELWWRNEVKWNLKILFKIFS